jgi:hypothetical protein
VQWGQIKSITYERTDSYYDLTVPGAEHYLAEGIWHHNTGKTYGILRALHCIAADYPNLRILICRQTRASLTESVMVTYEAETLVEDAAQSIAYGASRRTRQSYNYPNGSTIVLGGLDKPDRILSTAWDIVYVNECVEVQEEAWDALWGRLNRPGRPSWLGYLIGDTNPGDPGHYLKKRADAGEIGRWQVDHKANPALWDGRDWTPAGKQYLDSLGRLRGTRRKRFLEGIWAAGEGQWFECFGDGNVTTEAEFHPNYHVHLAVDSGVHTGAVWFQVRGEGDATRITVFGDYYSYGVPAYDAARAIVSRSHELCRGRVDRSTTDPAGKAANAVGPTVLGEYARAGFKPESWPSFPGSVADGLGLINSFVAIDPPALTVHPRCTKLIEAFANYKRAKRAGQFIDRPEDPCHPHEDLLDALRGGLQDKFPEGRRPALNIQRVPRRSVI